MAEDFLPYLNTFIESIHDCVSRHTHLFTDEELLQLQELLRLPVTHQHLLSRLVLRKHEWLRTNSFTNYLGRCYTQQDIDVTVHGLLANSTIDSITSKTPFEDVWNAITTTLTVEELSSLLVMISSKKAKVVGKTNILLELQKIVHKQKNLFGHLLKNTLGKALASVLSSHETNPCLLVRVKPSILLLIRRVQRLHQVTFLLS